MLSELEEETQEALSEHESSSIRRVKRDLHRDRQIWRGRPYPLRKLTIDGNIPQWVDGPKTTGGDGTDSDNRGMKSAGDGTIVEGGTLQLNIQELGQEQQLTLHKHETQEAFS